MSRRLGIIISGLCALAVLIAVWVLPDRTESGIRTDAPNAMETSSITSTPSESEADNSSTNIIFPDDPRFDQDAEIEQLTLETEAELEAPEEQEAAQYARVTANMSIVQMAELQKFRQGTIVRDADGRLKHPYAEAKKCDATKICKTTIINTRSNETVWNGSWVKGYTMTGVGMEVVRNK